MLLHSLTFPNIADVHVMGKDAQDVRRSALVVGPHELKIDTTGLKAGETPYSLVAESSPTAVWVLISRFGRLLWRCQAVCNIGAHKKSTCILGLEALGVEFGVEGTAIFERSHGITSANRFFSLCFRWCNSEPDDGISFEV